MINIVIKRFLFIVIMHLTKPQRLEKMEKNRKLWILCLLTTCKKVEHI